MQIGASKFSRITIKDQKGQDVVIITDEGAKGLDEYDVIVDEDEPDLSNVLAKPGDIFTIDDDEEEDTYMVIDADEFFFYMVETSLELETCKIAYDYTRRRTYPNDKRLFTLEQF